MKSDDGLAPVTYLPGAMPPAQHQSASPSPARLTRSAERRPPHATRASAR